MSIKEFELFHGAVLTKLVRSDRPLTLRMIETRPGEAWSIYKLNDAVKVLVKHSRTPRKLKRDRAGASWPFSFSRDQVLQLRSKDAWVALVCGADRVGDAKMEVCLLKPEEVGQLLDVQSEVQQSVTVKYLPGKRLRVSSARWDELVVPRNRVENWEVPGS